MAIPNDATKLSTLTKKEARAHMRQKLRGFTPQYRIEAATEIVQRLKPTLKGARSVFLFAGTKLEIKTSLIDAFLREEKIGRSYPCIKKNRMRALRTPEHVSMVSFALDQYGIPSPKIEWPEEDPKKVEIVIVPGLAFDLRGQRLGQGGGYYDRALPSFSNARYVAIGFDEQLVSELPTHEHDIAVHAFISNKRVLPFNDI